MVDFLWLIFSILRGLGADFSVLYMIYDIRLLRDPLVMGDEDDTVFFLLHKIF